MSKVTVSVTDSASPHPAVATRTLTLDVGAAQSLTIGGVPLTAGTEGSYYFAQLPASGGAGPYTWAVTAGSVPPGLTLASDGTLAGAPSGVGTYSFTATVTDSATPTPDSATGSFTVAIDAPAPLHIPGAGLPAATQGGYYFYSFTADGGIGPYTWTLQSGSLPAGLSLSPAGIISGAPTGTGLSSFTVSVSDSATAPATASQSFNLPVTAGAPLSSAVTTLADATAGQAYQQRLTATGGVAPYLWSVASGSLPAGLTLDPSGLLHGSPTESGTFAFTLAVSDSATPNPYRFEKNLTLTVQPASPLASATDALPDATQGQLYTQTLSATGGVAPYTWAVVSGQPPAGLTLGADGTLSGFPDTTGSSTFTVAVTDSAAPSPATKDQTLTLTVDPFAALSVPSSALPAATQGVPYGTPLASTGGVGPYTWSLLSGSLPAGLTLSSSGWIDGAATAAGTFRFEVGVTDSESPKPVTASRAMSLVVETAPTLTIGNIALGPGTVGQLYSDSLWASGGVGPYQWRIMSGALPAGLALDAATGAVTGEPSAKGTSSFTVEVTDSSTPTSATATLALTIAVGAGSALAVDTTALPAAYQGQPYSTPLSASGGTQPYTWSLASGQLPSGLSLQPSGLITGTAAASGSYSFTVAVTDSAAPTPATVKQSYTLVVQPAQALMVETAGLNPAVAGAGYYGQLYVLGGVGPYSITTISGSLPPGIRLYPSGGISGTPTTPGTYAFTVAVSDSASPTPDTTTEALSLVVSAPAELAVSGSPPPAATQGAPYSAQLKPSGGVGPYQWAVATGALPQGLHLDAASGTISGTPAVSGQATFEVRVTDSETTPATATGDITMTVAAAAPLALSTPYPAPATVGQPYTLGLGATGGFAPYTWTLAGGSLPPGLQLSPDGTISGQPTAAGDSSFTVKVTDAASPTPATATAQVTLQVGAAQPLSVQTGSLTAEQGQPTDDTLAAAGGVAPYTWSVGTGTLPPGLSLSPDGTLTGTPTGAGTTSVTFTVTDSASGTPSTVEQAIQVEVQPAVALTVAAPALPAATRNVAYSQQVPVRGGVAPYTFTLAAGALPAGLHLDSSTGQISGTPTGDTAATVTLEVADSATPKPHTVTASLAIPFTASPGALAVTGPPAFGFGVGQPVAQALTASGGAAPYTWSLLSGQTPPGTSLADSGAIEGTPTTAGFYSFVAEVTDSATPTPATATQQIAVLVLPPPLRISTSSLPGAVVGSSYSSKLASVGGVGTVSWTIASGSLPAGLTLSGDQIAGTVTGQAGDYPVTFQATDSAVPVPQSVQATLALTVSAPVSVKTAGLPAAVQGQPYRATLAPAGGIGPFAWSVTAGSLPAGLTLEPSGAITGTPTTAGTSTFTVEVADGEKTPGTATASLSLTVGGPASLTVSTTSLPGATAGQPYYQKLEATGGVGPYTWSASSPLPAGLVLNADGTITGTATTVGTTDFEAVATDSAAPTPDTAGVSLSIVVGASGPVVSLGAAPAAGTVPLATALVLDAHQAGGDTLSYQVDFGDGTSPVTGTISSPYTAVSLAHTYQTAGAYVARVVVVDTTSNLSSASSTVVRVASATAQPPVPSITVAPGAGMAPLATTIDISGTDPAGLPLAYTLNFGDGTAGVHGELVGSTVVNHTYTSSGTFTVTLDETDGTLSATRTATVTVAPAQPLVASAGDPQTVTVGQAVQFDGSGSQPAAAIQTYSWQFGDGSSGAGIDASHVYTKPGTYTATLTITSGSLTSSATATVTVAPVSPYGLKVTVSGNGAPLPGAEAMVIEGNGQRVTATADGSGVATLAGLPDGSYSVYVYQPGYQPGAVTASVSGGDGKASIILQPGPVAKATLSSKRLTEAQIVAAGIDPNAPGNQNVFSFTANLAFGPDNVDFAGFICGSEFCGATGFGGGGGSGGVISYCGTYCYYPTPDVVDGQPNLEWLVIPGKVTFLKEFFKVTLLVQNLAAPSFTLSDGSATLNVPSGMSLAPTSKPQNATVTVPDIPGGQTASVDWYIRGDKQGSYPLSANYSSLLQPFGAPVTVTAQTKDPVKVWGASALQMTVDADATATVDNPYDVRVGLKNVSDVPVYNASVALSDQSPTGYIFQPEQQLAYSTGVIEPGQTFWTPYYVLVPQTSGALNLSQAFVSQVGGNTNLKTTVVTHPAVDNPAPQIKAIALRNTVSLSWDTVPGATSYEVFSTPSPTTPFPSTPLKTVPAPPAGHTSQGYNIAGVDPNSTGWYTVSSVISGRLTMLHPLIQASSSSVSDQPDVTLTSSNNGCSGADVTVTATIVDTQGIDTVNPPKLTQWSYQIGSAAPVVASLSGGSSATKTFVVSSKDIPRDGITITVSASDSLGDGPPATITLGGCPYIGSVTNVPDVENPTIVIKGFGFGTGGAYSPAFATSGDSHYLQIADTAKAQNWTAGGYTQYP